MMAEGRDSAERRIEELREEITCPICQGYFQDPKILPCLHCCCKECIRQLASRNRPFSCPKCNQDTLLPQNNPDVLPTAFLVNRMKEQHTSMEMAGDKVMTACEMCSRSKAVAFCHQCSDFICSDCVNSHVILKVFRGHKVVTLEELKQCGISLKESPPLICPEHEEQLKIFCFDCNRLICRNCIIPDHSDHKHNFAKKLAPEYKKKLNESLTPLRKIHDIISAAARKVESIEKEVSDQHTSVSNAIDCSFEQLFELLKLHKLQLLKKASELTKEKLGALTAQAECFQIALAESQRLNECVEQNVEHSSDEELMSIQQQILTRLHEFCRKYEEIDQRPATIPDIALEVCIPASLTFGKLYHSVVDPTKCTAGGPGIDVVDINKQTHVTIHARYSDGSSCCVRQRVVTELKSRVNSSVIQAKVVESGIGVYEATYTPKIRGRHILHIRVNGKEIDGSPFDVFVKIHPAQFGKPVRDIGGVQQPWAITFNNKEEIVVTQWLAKEVSVMEKHGKKLWTISCDKLQRPCGVSLDKDDNIFVTDCCENALFKFNKEGEYMEVLQEKGSQPGELKNPGFVRIFNEKVFICDTDNYRIQVLDTHLNYVHSFGQKGIGKGQFDWPKDVVQDQAGNLYVTDHDNHRVQVFSCEGQFLYTFCEKGHTTNKLKNPVGICYDVHNNFVFVSETGAGCISVFKPSGEFVASFGELNYPTGVAVDKDGFVYVCEFLRDINKIVVF